MRAERAMRTRHIVGLVMLVISATVGLAAAQTRSHRDAVPFAITSDVPSDRLMAQAMDRMHDGMMAAKPTGDPDRDFLSMMIPHHQGAIDMAKIVLLHTKDSRIRNLAQSIITGQQYEINLMNNLLRQPDGNTSSVKENAQ
jgi:uncharacterized protein (DUF305 family)